MDFKLREPELGDVFLLSKIMRKTEIRKDVKSLFVDLKEGDKVEDVSVSQGFEFAILIFENLDKAEPEILKLLGDLAGMTPKELRKLKMNEVNDLFMAFGELEGLTGFFKSAAKLMK